jgi:phospholipase C
MNQVKTIVFLMLENRSLDNVLGWLYKGRERPYVFPEGSSPDFNGIPVDASQPLDDGIQYPIVARPDTLGNYAGYVPYWDPTEPMYSPVDWRGVMNQMFGNAKRISGMPKKGTRPTMKGFFQDYYEKYVSQGYGWKDILWMFEPTQLPVLNMLSFGYGVSDAWHCSVPTQTNPNRAYSLIGTSQGRNNNSWDAVETYDGKTFLNVLGDAGKTWGLYYTDTWHSGKSFTEYTFPALSNAGGDIAKMDKFYALLHDGKLPNFCYLEPSWGYSVAGKITQGTDYHPPTDVYFGERFLLQLFLQLRLCKQWNEMLFIVTFDEHGGTYDHVEPTWDATNPDGKNGDYGFDFTLFGPRVPTLLISPFVKQGTVFRAPTGSKYPFYDHTSFINTFLRWAGVDVTSKAFNLGARMPVAPHFDAVLFPTAVNDAVLEEVDIPEPDTSRALNGIFKGVGFASVRRIMHDNDTVEGMKADVARYHADPAAFEAKLGKPPA